MLENRIHSVSLSRSFYSKLLQKHLFSLALGKALYFNCEILSVQKEMHQQCLKKVLSNQMKITKLSSNLKMYLSIIGFFYGGGSDRDSRLTRCLELSVQFSAKINQEHIAVAAFSRLSEVKEIVDFIHWGVFVVFTPSFF